MNKIIEKIAITLLLIFGGGLCFVLGYIIRAAKARGLAKKAS